MTVIATLKIYNPPTTFQGMTSTIGLIFSVGDTVLRFTISIEQDKLELVTLTIIFGVVNDATSNNHGLGRLLFTK